MLQQNRLYHSVQLKMASLLIWIIWCFKNMAKMAKFGQNTKSIIRRFHQFLGHFCQYGILISLECAVDSEWDGVIGLVVSCSVAELFIHTNHKKNPGFSGLKTTTLFSSEILLPKCCGAWNIFQVLYFMREHYFASGWKSFEAHLRVDAQILHTCLSYQWYQYLKDK